MKSRSFNHFLFSFILLALIIAANAFWYLEVTKQATRAAELEGQIETIVESAVAAEQTSDTLAALAADEAAIKGYSVPLADIVTFLERVEGTGRALTASVEVVTVADKPGSDGRIPMTIRILGSFDSVLRTLGAIEYGPYDSRVQSLTFDTPVDGNAWTAIVTLSVAVTQPPKP